MAAHMRGQGTPGASDQPNTTDPFAPDYVNPALSRRDRRRAARSASGEGRGCGWLLLYLLAAIVVTALVWFLFGGGV